MNTPPALARNKMRTPTYAAMALTSLAIFLGGLSPLFIQNGRTLNLMGFYGVILGAAPLLLMRTHFFDRMITSGAGRDHSLVVWHSALFKLLLLVIAIAVLLMVWRSTTVGLTGWKTGFLLFYGLFFFYAAGWLLRAPSFMLRELE